MGNAIEGSLSKDFHSKLDSVISGTGEDVTFEKAMAVLADERSKIKTPRSTKARLDILYEKASGLREELSSARLRDEQIREWTTELYSLYQRHRELEEQIQKEKQKHLEMRRAYLMEVLDQVNGVELEIVRLTASMEQLGQSPEVSQEVEEQVERINREMEMLSGRIEDGRKSLRKIEEQKTGSEQKLAAMSYIEELGIDAPALAAMYTRYLSAKGAAVKAERNTNEAKKELFLAEKELSDKTSLHSECTEGILSQVENLLDTKVFEEKEKARLETEVEKTRGSVLSLNPAASSGWISALALGALASAVIMTLLNIPYGIPALVVSLMLFGIGVYRYKTVASERSKFMRELEAKEIELEEQAERVRQISGSLDRYLAAAGVKSVEQFRRIVKDTTLAADKVKSLKDRTEAAKAVWYEALGELSSMEKEFVEVLTKSGCMQPGENISDTRVEKLKAMLNQAGEIRQEIKSHQRRYEEIDAAVKKLSSRLDNLAKELEAVFKKAGVSTHDEFRQNLENYREYEKVKEALERNKNKLAFILAGRTKEDLQEELAAFPPAFDSEHRFDGVTQRDCERQWAIVQQLRTSLSKVESRIKVLETSVNMKSSEGRNAAQIEEDLMRLEEEIVVLEEDKEALELSLEILESVSKAIRRDFAPALSKEAGKVLGQITGTRYVDVKVSPELDIHLILPDTGTQVNVDALSGGTIDQAYFALRLALAKTVMARPDFPLFLDDSFIQYDDGRLEGVMEILKQIACEHQILLFSCQGREEVVAKRLNIPYHPVHLN